MYDNSSINGDFICDDYDDKNNFMIPETPTGYYVYKVIGGGFDRMDDWDSQFLQDLDILSCDAGSLDLFWGVSYNMPRPSIGEPARPLTDDEYRVYLYLRNCQLLTMQDIMICLGKCFNKNTDYGTEEIYVTEISHYLEATDHLIYDAKTDETTDLGKRDDDTSKHFITSFSDDADTETFDGYLVPLGETQSVINIPYNNWSSDFLEFMEQYISIKGDLLLREVSG